MHWTLSTFSFVARPQLRVKSIRRRSGFNLCHSKMVFSASTSNLTHIQPRCVDLRFTGEWCCFYLPRSHCADNSKQLSCPCSESVASRNSTTFAKSYILCYGPTIQCLGVKFTADYENHIIEEHKLKPELVQEQRGSAGVGWVFTCIVFSQCRFSPKSIYVRLDSSSLSM